MGGTKKLSGEGNPVSRRIGDHRIPVPKSPEKLGIPPKTTEIGPSLNTSSLYYIL